MFDRPRGERAALRRTLLLHRHHTAQQHTGSQVAADQGPDPPVLNLAAYPCHQLLVVDFVEKPRQVHVHHPAFALLLVLPCSQHRLVGVAPPAKSVTVFRKLRLVQRT